MNAFDLLKEPIKQYIWRLGWRKFYPIQEAAVKYILTTKDNYLLSSRTASGKTEAAFLPAINSIENWHDGVKILYISPLIALINDQFTRIEKLCEHLDIKITKWHGEANRTEKQKLVRSPEGIVLITPESIEAMFTNHPEQVIQLFQNLEFVVIDEIHSFLGTLRGKHLQSLLQRLEQINSQNLRYIGLSATLSEETYTYAKDYFPSLQATKVLLDNERNELSVSVFYFEAESASLPVELIEDIYNKTQTRKTLIFPNTRGRVEEVAVKLKKLASEQGGHANYFAHHSSVDRDLREFVENFAKSSLTQNFAISCTSTLELGIDIGSVDTVVQVDSTFSIASLVQRLGRSGRIDHKSNLLLYATDPWSLLQSIACIELYKERFIEPIADIKYPLDILLQQMLSLLKQHSGLAEADLLVQLSKNKAFTNIPKDDVLDVIKYLLETQILEKTEQDLIIGIEGERIVNKKDFYSLFETEDNFKVEFKGKVIGELPLSPQILVNENIFLSANIWKIKEIDLDIKKIFVTVAKDGKRPKFFGSGGDIHSRIRQKMFEILLSEIYPTYLDSNAATALKELRQKFKSKAIENVYFDRPIIETESKSNFYSFTGSKINRTIFLYSNISYGDELKYYESESSFEGSASLLKMIQGFRMKNYSADEAIKYLMNDLTVNPNKYKLGKFAVLLPVALKAKYLIENYYSLPEANEYLMHLRVV